MELAAVPKSFPPRLRVLGPILLLALTAVLLTTLRPVHLHVSNVSQVAVLIASSGAGEQPAAPPPEVLRIKATVHGPMEKAGTPDPRWWLESEHKGREKDFMGWVDASTEAARQASEANSSADPPVETPPGIFPFCEPYVNHQYKILYMRCPKAASSSVLVHFSLCDNPGLTLGVLKPWCLIALNRSLPQKELEAIWRDYYVFAFTRSPFSRALSTYKFLSEMVVDEARCAPAPNNTIPELSWDAFCRDPAVMGRACRVMPENCCLHGDGFMFHHTVEQARCLTTAEGGWAVDYLGRVEHMEADLQEIVRAVKLRTLTGGLEHLEISAEVAVMNSGGKCGEAMEISHPGLRLAPEQYCNREEYFSGKHAHCRGRLSQYYAADLELLGIEPLA